MEEENSSIHGLAKIIKKTLEPFKTVFSSVHHHVISIALNTDNSQPLTTTYDNNF